jgi:nucleotide-binding universal stress UspA family protein
MSSPALRLLVATDFSSASLRALRAARRLKERAGGSITLLHVRPPSDVRAAVLEERGDLVKEVREALRAGIQKHYQKRLSAIIGDRPGESWKVAKGKPALEICREAGRGYDLVFAASHGAGAAARLLLGSTVQELLLRSPIPVTVAPPR